MFRILIVDDELLVRTNIKLFLQQTAEDFTVCGEADNGRTGLEQVRLLHPDIIFSDMKMPEMDGVEFCRQVHEQYPGICFIALSNYDEYSYVRGALKSGASDYILKHKLNKEYLAQILNDLKKNMKTDSTLNTLPDITLTALQEKFVLHLLGHMFVTEKEVEANLKVLGIRLDLSSLIPIILSVDNYAKIEQQGRIEQRNILEFSILNIGNELLSQHPTGLLTHIEKGIYCILLSFAQIPSRSKIQEQIHSILNQISYNLKNYLNISASFCIGELTANILDVGVSYNKALEAMQLKFYSGNHSIIHSQNIAVSRKELSGLDYAIEKKLLALITNGSGQDAEVIIRQVFQGMAKQKENRSNVQMICMDLLSIITRLSKKNGIALDLIIAKKVPPDQLFTQLNTLNEIQDWFLDCFHNICLQIQQLLPGDSLYVKSAITCINRDFAKPISQQTVAEDIGISGGYLSTIFKAETGQGFADYLNTVRISNAAHMLELGERDFHKIAEACGYQDYAYFFKVFKKRMGTTPGKYLSSKRN